MAFTLEQKGQVLEMLRDAAGTPRGGLTTHEVAQRLGVSVAKARACLRAMELYDKAVQAEWGPWGPRGGQVLVWKLRSKR